MPAAKGSARTPLGPKETFAFFDKNKDGQVNIEFRKMSLALGLFAPD